MSDGVSQSMVWDHEDCPIDGCEGELQQQDRFNVMCLSCETVWTHHKDEEKHILSRPDHHHEFTKPVEPEPYEPENVVEETI